MVGGGWGDILYIMKCVHSTEVTYKVKKKVFMVRASSNYTQLNLMQGITRRSKREGLDAIKYLCNTPLGN